MNINNLDSTILNPGGNITGLVSGIPSSRSRRKFINDAVMKRFPQVEQVGFLDMRGRRLEMAGGEFCGNATRCAAYLLLDGKPGRISLSVSGAGDKKLRTRIDNNKLVWAQMPLLTASIRKAGDCLHCAPKRDYSSCYFSETAN